MMIRTHRPGNQTAITSAVLLLLIAGCSSPKVTSRWRDPDFSGPIQFKKTVVLAIHPDAAVRRVAEDEMVKQIGAGRAVAGYDVVSDEERKDVTVLRSRIEAQGVDGALTMKLAGSHTEMTDIPDPASDQPFNNYYDRAGALATGPRTTVTTQIVGVQTNVYTVADGKLIWSGTVELYNPTNAHEIVDDVARTVRDQLRKEKLLP